MSWQHLLIYLAGTFAIALIVATALISDRTPGDAA